MNAASFDAPSEIGWRTTVRVAAVWLVACPLAGIAVAEFSGEFGSLAFVVMGICIGVLGAFIHAALSRSRWFLRRPYILQALLTAAAPASPLLLFAALEVGSAVGFLGFLEGFALPICGFPAGAAWIGSEIIYQSDASGSCA